MTEWAKKFMEVSNIPRRGLKNSRRYQTPPVASCPPLRALLAGTLPCPRAVPPFLDHAPGIPLPLQLRQRDARRRTLGRRGGHAVSAPGGRTWGGTAWGGWCGYWWGRCGHGTLRPPCPLLLLRRPPARRPGPAPGPSPASAACQSRLVAGRGGGVAHRGRNLNPWCTLLSPLCGRGSPRRCARVLRWGYSPCRWRAGSRGRGRGAACWGCGLSPPCAWRPLPGRGGRACCLGGGGGLLDWPRPLS